MDNKKTVKAGQSAENKTQEIPWYSKMTLILLWYFYSTANWLTLGIQ